MRKRSGGCTWMRARFLIVLSSAVATAAAYAQAPSTANGLTEHRVADVHSTKTTRSVRQAVVAPMMTGATADLLDGDHQPIGFTGYIKDVESGLYYAKARYYDPRVGRFTTQDPADGNPLQPPSLHRYLYAYANPTTYTDRTGRQVNDDDVGQAAIALGWNDEQYRNALKVQAAAHEQTAGAAYSAGKLTAQGLWEVTKYGGKLLGKALFDIGDAKDIVDPVVHVVKATADAVRAGP